MPDYTKALKAFLMKQGIRMRRDLSDAPRARHNALR